MAMAGVLGRGRDASRRVCLKAWGERDHHSVILRQSDEAGMDFFAFKVDSDATLDKLEKDLQSWGLKTERLPAEELLETGERMRFEIFREEIPHIPICSRLNGIGKESARAARSPSPRQISLCARVFSMGGRIG